MTADRLDNTDLGVLDAALDLLEKQGDWQQVTDVGRLREKLERMGVRNVVPWGRDLSVHLSEQVDLVAHGKRGLDHFLAELDNGYPDGRDADRSAFLEAVRDLARKCAPRREGKETKA